jgi:hypothetical protein
MHRDVTAREARSSRAQTETGKSSPKHDEGAVCARWVRCGRTWCRCMRGGPKHGPYFARYWWQDGRRHKRYVRQHDAADAAIACAARREAERSERGQADEARQAWQAIRALLREIEHG